MLQKKAHIRLLYKKNEAQRRVARKRSSLVLTGLFVVFGLYIFTQSTIAAFNPQINYQGKLTDGNNLAVTDGTYHMKFRLYTVETGGTEIWEGDRSYLAGNRVPVTNGLFSVLLGSSTALTSVDFDQTLYLEVSIGGTASSSWETLLPRKKLGAVPAAFVADTLDGVDSTQFLRSDEPDTMASSSASTLLTITQTGSGDILNLSNGSEVFTVLNDGKVGIGTSTPTEALVVSGTGKIKIGDQTANPGGKLRVTMDDNDSETQGIKVISMRTTGTNYGYNGTAAGVGAAKNIGLYSWASGATQNWGLWVQSGDAIFEGGYVGIGTTSPYAKLSVTATAGQTNPIFTVASSSQEQYFTITSDGKVGVGTSSPAYPLDVYGNARVDGTLTVEDDLSISTNGSSPASPRVGAFTNLSSGEAARFQFGDEHNAFQNAYANDVNIYSYWGLTLTGGMQNYNSGFNPMPFSKYTDVGVIVLSDSYVSNDPSNAGNPIETFAIKATTSQWTNLMSFRDSSNNKLSVVDYEGKFSIGTDATSTYSLNVVGGSSMDDLTVSNKIGVGTTSPYAKLSVTATGGQTNPIFTVASSSQEQYFTIASDGKVGIGTSSPAYSLDVYGDARVDGNLTVLGDMADKRSGINVETLASDKTLDPNTDKIYQYLSDGGTDRIITLATSTASAGDKFVVKHNGTYGTNRFLEVRQSGTVLDKIYAGGTKEFIFNGTNWVGAENGSGEDDNKKYNVGIGNLAISYGSGAAVGYNSGAQNSGAAIGYNAQGYQEGAAVGYGAYGYSSGVAIGYGASAYASGVAVGRSAIGNNYGTAIGYNAESAQYGFSAGYSAGTNIDNANSTGNILIGRDAGDIITTGDNNIIIGYQADSVSSTTNSFLNIGDTIYGDLSTGYVGIGTTSPYAKLSVVGETVSEYFTATSITATSTFKGNLHVYDTLQVGTSSIYLHGGATSTFSYGIDVAGTDGCVAVNGVCIVDKAGPTLIVAATNSKNTSRADYVCSGVSCEDEINAALSALPSSGGMIQLLDGVYTMATSTYSDCSIKATSSVAIVGSGASTVLKIKDSFNANLNVICNTDTTNGNDHIIVSDLKIDGNKANNSSGSQHGIYLTRIGSGEGVTAVSGARIENLWVENLRDWGLYFASTTNSIVTGNTVILSDDDSVLFITSDNNIITNNTIQGGAETGAYFSGSSYNTISGNSFLGNAYRGIMFNNSSLNNAFTSNTVKGNLWEGFYISSSSNNNTITGNQFHDNGGAVANHSISVANTSNANIISSNNITDTEGSGHAIKIASGCDNNYLIGNRYSGTGASSIDDAGASTTIQHSNQFTIDAYGSTALTVTQTGVADIVNVFDGSDEVFTILNGGNVGIGTSSPAAKLSVGGFVNVDQYSGYKQAGNTILFASSTNQGLFAGIGAGANINSSGLQNTFLGHEAGYTATSSGYNTFVGYQAGYSDTTGYANIAMGFRALASTTIGFANSAVGVNSLRRNTIGEYNSALGMQALSNNTTGDGNVAVGSSALYHNTTGFGNTALGFQAVASSTTGYGNTALGFLALGLNSSTSKTVAIGYEAGIGSSGDEYSENNVLIGYKAGREITAGDNNILLGSQAGDSLTTGNNNIIIGHDIDHLTSATSYRMNIGNTIFGDLSTNYIGLGVINPNYRLHVAGTTVTNSGIAQERANDSSYGPTQRSYKSRGTPDIPTGVLVDDILGRWEAYGYSDGAHLAAGWLDFLAGATTSGALSGKFKISLKDSLGDPYTRFYIDDEGDVGLGGESTPTSLLEVAGAEDVLSDVGVSSNYLQILRRNISTTGTGAGLGFSVTNTDNNIGAAIIHKRTSSNSMGELQFYTKQTTTGGADPTQVMVLTDAGRVGIGTSTPSSKLDVSGGSLSVNYPSNPVEVGYVLDTESGGTAQVLDNTQSVYVSGNYAYVVSLWDDGLSIIDISDPTSPTEVGYIQDTEEGGTAQVLDMPYDVHVSGNYAYVTSGNDDGLSIIDISDPTSPTEVGYIQDNNLGGTAQALDGAMNIYVSGNYAYIASFNDDGLSIIDISDPTSPTEAGYIQDTEEGGTAQVLDYAKDVYVSGNYAYVTSYNDDGLSIIDISDPTSPTEVGYIQDTEEGGTAQVLDGAQKVCVSGNYAYVTSDLDMGLSIIDISDPTNPFEDGYIQDTEESGIAQVLDSADGLYVSNNYAYVTSYDDAGLSIINVSSSTNPVEIGYVQDTLRGGVAQALGYAQGIYVSGKYAYVTSGYDNALSIIDLNGAEISTLHAGNIQSNDIAVIENVNIGNNLYVGNALNIGPGGLLSQGQSSFSLYDTNSLDKLTAITGNITDSRTNSIADILKLTHSAYGTAASGIGAGLLFALEDASGTATNTARIASLLTNTSTTSPASALTFSTKNTSGTLTERMRINEDGKVGIGTTSPYAKLSVTATAGQTNPIFTVASSSEEQYFTITSDGKVGIGTTTPERQLDILHTVANAQQRISYDSTKFVEFYVNSTGDLEISTVGEDVRILDENLWVCTGGGCGATAPADKGNVIVETALIFDNDFKLKQTSATSVTMYDSNDNVLMIFDE